MEAGLYPLHPPLMSPGRHLTLTYCHSTGAAFGGDGAPCVIRQIQLYNCCRVVFSVERTRDTARRDARGGKETYFMNLATFS